MLEIRYIEPMLKNPANGRTYLPEHRLEAFSKQYEVLSVASCVPAPAPAPVRVDPVGNCLYGGNARGHSRGFCTADSCY